MGIATHSRSPPYILYNVDVPPILVATDWFYYRAKLRVVRYCHGKMSVRPSVFPSVTLRYNRDHIGWNSAKIISRLISLTISLSVDPNKTDLLQREHLQILNFSQNRSGVGKNVDFRHLSRRMSESWNGARQGSSCYWPLIGICRPIRAFDWYQNRWPWMTSERDSMSSIP